MSVPSSAQTVKVGDDRPDSRCWANSHDRFHVVCDAPATSAVGLCEQHHEELRQEVRT